MLFAPHLVDFNYNINKIEDNMEVLQRDVKDRSMDSLEEYEICKLFQYESLRDYIVYDLSSTYVLFNELIQV